MSAVSRRGILKGILAGAIVLGFDPAGRSWVTEARADVPFAGLPALDGTLSTDPAVLDEVADDFGHIVHRRPLAVLRAGSVDDVVKMIKYARAHGIKVVGRGNGHTTFGQSQTAGIVVDTRQLNQIYSITNHQAVVGAGVVWRDLLQATVAVGRTPPVLTDYIELTVGGTLSVGGIGGMSFRHGVQLDNVDELMVVTGTGQIVVCSPNKNSALFNVALGGLGLCAIIVRATLKLIKAEERARTYHLFYPDVATMLADVRTLIAEKRFDYVRGTGAPAPTPSGWGFFIEATNYYTPGGNVGGGHHHHDADEDEDCDCDDEDELLAGLSFIPGITEVLDSAYFDYCDATDQIFAQLDAAGLLSLPHPWLDLFIPGSTIDTFGPAKVAEMDPTQMLPGSFVLFFGFERSKITRPMFRVPEESIFFLFDFIRTSLPDPAVLGPVLQKNRSLMVENRAQGGTHYTISTVEMSHADWVQYYGPVFPFLSAVKAAFDPNNVLGGGTAVFAS